MEVFNSILYISGICYGRKLLQAWLLPYLNTIPNNCIKENSLKLSGYGIGFWCTRLLVRILPRLYISAMHLFISFFVTYFVHKIKTLKKRLLDKRAMIALGCLPESFFPTKFYLLCSYCSNL